MSQATVVLSFITGHYACLISLRFDEHAQKDLPAMLNKVMEVTGQTDMFYAGHSQGTVMGFAGFTVNQDLAKHIKTFFALAPVTTVKHIEGLFAVISEYYVYHTLEVS